MSGRINNVKTMRGVGIFADRTAKSSSLDLRKFNLIYGFNGSGKSTLSRLFASLEMGSLHTKLPPDSAFNVTMDDGTDYGYPSKPSGLERRLLVFNSDFIEQNLQWAVGKASPIFFIGTDQADAAEKLAALEAKIPQLESQETALQTAEKQAEKTLSTFKRERAKLVASKLHQGNRKYEAPQLTNDYERWLSEDISLLDENELNASEDTRRLAEPMPLLDTIVFDTDNIGKAFQFVREMCEQTLSTVALDEVQRFPEMLLWLKEGREFHESHDLERCLLCGNEFSEERLNTLKTALDNQIDQFIARLTKTAERLQVILGDLQSLEQNAPSSGAFSTELRPSFEEGKAGLLANIRLSKSQLDQLNSVLSTKLQRPATPADTSSLSSQAEVEETASQLAVELKQVNTTIDEHNKVVSDFAKHRDNAGVSIRKHYIAECRDDFVAHIDTLDKAKERAKKACEELAQAKSNANALRETIRTHGPAASVINQLVASYLGHDELTIHPVEEGYELRRYGKRIEGMPSEGEKTAIAISYFLSTIKSEGRKLKDLIVVIDDPVSSLDTKALNYACSLIRNRLAKASQLIILTHNQQCLNEFRKAWKNKARPPESKERTATFLFIDVTIPRDGSKRTSSLVEMSKLLREYDSEYHFLFSHVLKFAEKSHDYSEYGYMMPNVLRRVLDIFLAFKCPGSSGLPGKIEEICHYYPDLNRDRLSALERLSQVESHSDNLDDLISFSSMTLEETKQATEALLELMEKVDERHTTSLKRICA